MLSDRIGERSVLGVGLASSAVFLVHGLSSGPLSRWYGNSAEAKALDEDVRDEVAVPTRYSAASGPREPG